MNMRYISAIGGFEMTDKCNNSHVERSRNMAELFFRFFDFAQNDKKIKVV